MIGNYASVASLTVSKPINQLHNLRPDPLGQQLRILVCDIVDNIVTDYDLLKSGFNIPLLAYFVARFVKGGSLFCLC